MKHAEAIFNFWNTRPEHKNWRTHRVFTPKMVKAITAILKEGYSASYLCETIDNYYWARTTKGTWWHDVCQKTWDFKTFWAGGVRKDEMNWERFEPERFDKFDFFTDAYKQQYIAQKRKDDKIDLEYEEHRDWLMESQDRWDELEKNPCYTALVKMARSEIE